MISTNDRLEKSLANHFFISPFRGDLVLWDYLNQQQFKMDWEHCLVILKVAFNKHLGDNDFKALQNLENEKILVKSHENLIISPEKWMFDLLSYIYHVGTYDKGKVEASVKEEFEYFYDYVAESKIKAEEFNFKPLYSNNGIKLDELKKEHFDSSFLETLLKRKTSREFEKFLFPFGEFSSLLKLVYGNLHGEDLELSENNLHQYSYRKTSPSGGNIHPEEALLYIFDVEGIEEGLYYYNPDAHTLHLINSSKKNYNEISELLNGQFFANNCSFLVFHVCRLEKIAWKYDTSKSYKISYIETGAFIQTLQLAVTSLGKKFWQTGMFKDMQLDKFLGLDNNEFCQYVVAVGQGEGNAIPKKYINYLNRIS